MTGNRQPIRAKSVAAQGIQRSLTERYQSFRVLPTTAWRDNPIAGYAASWKRVFSWLAIEDRASRSRTRP